MKATEIKFQIVKNLRNYEAARLEMTCELLPEEDVNASFQLMKIELEQAFEACYQKPKPREELTMTSDKLQGVCSALRDGRADIALVQKSFIISKEVMTYLKNQNLI